MINKFFFIGLILICIFLYLYVKIEAFGITTTQYNIIDPRIAISIELAAEIARVLNVSVRRIVNITYTGDITSGKINVSFTILEPNFGETINNETNANAVGILANNYFISNNFNVIINGLSVKLTKTQSSTTPQLTLNSDFYNNKGLLAISDYAKNKYTASPTDVSLTNFYKLDIDSNFILAPKL